MDVHLKQRLTDVLLNAARHRRVLPYTRFHALFARSISLTTRYAALELVLQCIDPEHEADYGVLLARDNGLPGLEFFKRYKKHRLAEYTAIAGDPRYHNATLKQQRALVDAERARVYAHAAERMAVGHLPFHAAEAMHVTSATPPNQSAPAGASGFPHAGNQANAQKHAYSLVGGSRGDSVNTYTWTFRYLEEFGQYIAASFTRLQQGYIPDHRRDGEMVTQWTRWPADHPQAVRQTGIGPNRNVDPTTAEQGGSYSDAYPWGMVHMHTDGLNSAVSSHSTSGIAM